MRRVIRVLSWNLHDLPSFLESRHSERIKRVTTRVVELAPDVVTFQEVWLEQDAGPMIVALARQGYQAIESRDRSGMKESGLLTFVRQASGWTIDFDWRESFRDAAAAFKFWEGDGIARKGFQAARLSHPIFGRLMVLNTHLQAPYASGYEAVRRHQIGQLLDAARAHRGSGVPLLICGDLNTDPSEPLHGLFANATWIDLTAPFRAQCGCKTSFSGTDTMGSWLDYILALRDPALRMSAAIELQTNRHKDDPYSDHQGLFATVVVEDVRGLDVFMGALLAAAAPRKLTRRDCLRQTAAMLAAWTAM